MYITLGNEHSFEPFKHMVFYKREFNGDAYYVEISDIKAGVSKSYRPLSKVEFNDLFDLVSKGDKKDLIQFSFSNFINRKILSYKVVQNRLSISWCVPSHVNNFLFKKEQGKLYYPNLLFKVEHNKLRVYSYKGSLTENSKMYKAPFPNLYNNASMCFGNINANELISRDVSQLIKNFENSFFNSEFNALESANRTKSNTFELLKRLVKTGKKFPNNELVLQPKKTLKDVISKF